MNINMMQAITIKSAGGPEMLEISSLPIPTVNNHEILIKVEAAGVNRPDIMQRKGLYPPPKNATSPLLGLEVAGEVVQTHEASPFKIGDKVCALTNGGGYAEYCMVPASQCLPWPEGFNAFEAAALPETFFTVWTNLFEIGKLTSADKVLIHGGSGGIGTTAIQLASIFGATVFTTVGSDEKGNLCKKLGATEYINYHQEDFVDRVKKLTNQVGVNLILDIMAASYLNKNIDSLSEGGRLIIISFQGGVKANDLNLAKVVTKRLTISGSTLRPRSTEFKGKIAKSLHEKVWPLLSSRKIMPHIHQIFPFYDVQKAHQIMEEGAHSGKLILDFSKRK